MPYHVLVKSSNIPCVIIWNIRTFSNESEIRTFARRILDIPKDTRYLNIIYSTMIGVRYMHFCQQERAQNSANFDIKYALSKKLAVMHLCLSTLDIYITQRIGYQSKTAHYSLISMKVDC